MRISFTNFAVGSLAFCLLAGSALTQDTPSANPQPAATAATNDAATPAVTPSVPPVVTFDKGQLTVIANNGTLSDILNAIQQKTGAVMDSAAGMSTERVIGQFGPADPATVITQLLNGTSLNYVLVGAPDGQLAKVILTLRPAHVEVQTADEGGSRRHRRAFAEVAPIEPQDQPQPDAVQADISNTPPPPVRKRHRRGAADAQADPNAADPNSSDTASSDTTANPNTASNTTDGSNPSDPNATGDASIANAIGTVPGSHILAADVPPDILKAIQHGSGSQSSPSARNNNSFGPAPTSLGGSSPASGATSGGTYVLPGGTTVLGSGMPLPNGGVFIGGIRMSGR